MGCQAGKLHLKIPSVSAKVPLVCVAVALVLMVTSSLLGTRPAPVLVENSELCTGKASTACSLKFGHSDQMTSRRQRAFAHSSQETTSRLEMKRTPESLASLHLTSSSADPESERLFLSESPASADRKAKVFLLVKLYELTEEDRHTVLSQIWKSVLQVESPMRGSRMPASSKINLPETWLLPGSPLSVCHDVEISQSSINTAERKVQYDRIQRSVGPCPSHPHRVCCQTASELEILTKEWSYGDATSPNLNAWSCALDGHQIIKLNQNLPDVLNALFNIFANRSFPVFVAYDNKAECIQAFAGGLVRPLTLPVHLKSLFGATGYCLNAVMMQRLAVAIRQARRSLLGTRRRLSALCRKLGWFGLQENDLTQLGVGFMFKVLPSIAV